MENFLKTFIVQLWWTEACTLVLSSPTSSSSFTSWAWSCSFSNHHSTALMTWSLFTCPRSRPRSHLHSWAWAHQRPRSRPGPGVAPSHIIIVQLWWPQVCSLVLVLVHVLIFIPGPGLVPSHTTTTLGTDTALMTSIYTQPTIVSTGAQKKVDRILKISKYYFNETDALQNDTINRVCTPCRLI